LKRTISAGTLGSLSLMLFFCVAARGQEKQQPTNQDIKQAVDAPTTEQVQLLSTSVVNEIESSLTNQRWTPADPSKNKAITVVTRLARGFDYSTKDFVLAFKSPDKEQRVKAIGHTPRPPSGWIVAEEGSEWRFFPGEMKGKPTIDIGLLFLLPIEVDEVTLMYKDKAVGKPISIKQDRSSLEYAETHIAR